MKRVKLTIPKEQTDYKLYIYRNRDRNKISTIGKCRKENPIIKVDQNIAETDINNRFVIYDEPECVTDGIEYLGPNINYERLPLREFELKLNTEVITNESFLNQIELSPLPISNKILNGYVFYYSIIGVKEEERITSYLTTKSTVVDYPKDEEMEYVIYSCNEYNNSINDIWNEVGVIEYSEGSIKIGASDGDFNNPVIETVPKAGDISFNISTVLSNNFMVLKVQNPWKGNDPDFNKRKLKSYKICTRIKDTDISSDFSEPTYQSSVPVPIEKIVIYTQVDNNLDIEYEDIDENDRNCMVMIKKNGIYYDRQKHKNLILNQRTVPEENRHISLFSNNSLMDEICIQVPATCGHEYTFNIFLVDVYGNPSVCKTVSIEV